MDSDLVYLDGLGSRECFDWLVIYGVELTEQCWGVYEEMSIRDIEGCLMLTLLKTLLVCRFHLHILKNNICKRCCTK